MLREITGDIQLLPPTNTSLHVQRNGKIQTTTLPNELWLYIAEFIPSSDRPKLLGINRMLFELVMSELYRHVHFSTSDPRVLSDQLRSLQNPNLAKRVRMLTLRPTSIIAAMRTQVDLKGRLTRYLLQGRSYVEDLFNHCQSTSLPDSSLPSPNQRVEMLVRAFRSLTHVEEFEVIWPYDIGPVGFASNFPFFPEIWQAISHNLLKLSMDIHAFKLGDAVKECGPLPQLEELHLTLSFAYPRGHIDEDLVPSFINKFSPTLKHLSVNGRGHHEFSKAFHHLGNFPQLNRLSLNIPLDILHLRDTSGLRRLLRTHPKIEHFCMKYRPCCAKGAYDGFESVGGKHAIYGDLALPAMHTLELGLILNISNNNAHPLYRSIARLGSNLMTLILQDCIMEFEEIKTVLRMFPSHRLKKLLLMARALSPQLIDLLAQVCTALDSLSLHAELVVESDAFTWPTYNDAWVVSDWFGFGHAMAECVDLNIERYANWLLSDLSIMRWKQEALGHVYDWKAMLAIADAVPSLRSFAGRGHMILDVENIGDITTGVETLLDLGALDWYRGPRWLI